MQDARTGLVVHIFRVFDLLPADEETPGCIVFLNVLEAKLVLVFDDRIDAILAVVARIMVYESVGFSLQITSGRSSTSKMFQRSLEPKPR